MPRGMATLVTRSLQVLGRLLKRVYPLAILIAGWELYTSLAPVSPRLFPRVESIGSALGSLWAKGDIQYHLSFTLTLAVAGFVCAVIVGVAMGSIMARYRWCDRLFTPLIAGSYPIPKIALYPIFIFVFGIGTGSKFVLIFLECLYPMIINAYHGARSVRRSHLWVARNLEASEWQSFTSVIIPSALPHIFAGLRIALPVALLITLFTEMAASNTGLGYLMVLASSSFETNRVLALVVVTGLVGFALDRLLVEVRGRLLFWADRQD